MKRLITALITAGLAAVSLPCCAEPACSAVEVRAHVEAAQGTLTLADLLVPETCPQLYRQAAQVSLGTVPRAGSARVLDGGQIRRLIGGFGELGFADRGQNLAGETLARDGNQRIPERVVVRQRGAVKTCAEIAGFITTADRSQGVPGGSRWREDLDCAAAGDIPENASLELMKATWDAGLRRREFALRCSRPEDCIPFLVWSRAPAPATGLAQSFPARTSKAPQADGNPMARLIKPGQTAMLTWEQAGIRIVLPVTCLEGGGFGQFVRVRFKNAAGTLRAEIVGPGTLRASL